ncbi:hypothetical protein BCR34DRAFT_33559 [Clohesyomyces aquaticus]|uniref:Uncharacterized protein n=1 Tax=Clohesyomyces aquaticus TaxID=1231657 RepID=A0A1Y1Z8B5_9PLEO|nr:hypothetical protein BCR34DRAFT_33559 [Clohesyomyces aquaticus]
MPRQLPWLKKGIASTAQVKASPKPTKTPLVNDDDDDDFFAGTVLAPSRKGKECADPLASDDELPDVPPLPSRKARSRLLTSDCAPSSSPPPAILAVPPSEVEYMLKGIDKSQLRDDEWMMVEDELLSTAKLFTQHLHLAEYECLKKNLETKKEVSRPVVANAKPSLDGQFKAKADAQSKAQRKALKEVLSSEKGSLGDILKGPPKVNLDDPTSSSFSGSSRSRTSVPSRLATHPGITRSSVKAPPSRDTIDSSDISDDEDLDAPSRSNSWTKSAATESSKSKSEFAKPLLPSKAAAKPRRASKFDFDDFPAAKRSSSPSPTKDSSTSNTRRPPRSDSSEPTLKPQPHSRKRSTIARPAFDFLDDFDFPSRESLPKEQAERIAKRKAEKEKKPEKEKRKSVKLDDIPTFLF